MLINPTKTRAHPNSSYFGLNPNQSLTSEDYKCECVVKLFLIAVRGRQACSIVLPKEAVAMMSSAITWRKAIRIHVGSDAIRFSNPDKPPSLPEWLMH